MNLRQVKLYPRQDERGEIAFFCSAAVASKDGISVGAIGVTIHRVRDRYAEVLREGDLHTVSSPEDIDDEIRHLIAVVRGEAVDVDQSS